MLWVVIQWCRELFTNYISDVSFTAINVSWARSGCVDFKIRMFREMFVILEMLKKFRHSTEFYPCAFEVGPDMIVALAAA